MFNYLIEFVLMLEIGVDGRGSTKIAWETHGILYEKMLAYQKGTNYFQCLAHMFKSNQGCVEAGLCRLSFGNLFLGKNFTNP